VAGQDGDQKYPLAEFFASIETSPAAINIASYAAFGTLRERVMGEDYQRHSTVEELAEMVALLRTEMEAGALGLSSGLEYDPGSFSATDELVELARVTASYGGRYISHIRSEDQYFWEAIDEAINIGREARIPVQVGHYADLVLFDPDRVIDRATPETPHVPSIGIEKVWVNGQLVFEGGQITGKRPGKPIRRATGLSWNFVDIITPADLVTEALGWVAAGVRLPGGCCGNDS